MGWHLPRRTRTTGGVHVLCGGGFVEWGDGGEAGECHTCKIKDKSSALSLSKWKMIKESVLFFAPNNVFSVIAIMRLCEFYCCIIAISHHR